MKHFWSASYCKLVSNNLWLSSKSLRPLKQEFHRAGVALLLSEDYFTLSIKTGQTVAQFRTPTKVNANHGRLPGWFLAGIWDTLRLPELQELPDSTLLQGWGFKYEPPSKRMTVGEVKLLVYSPVSGRLFLQNYSAGNTTDIGAFPTKSVFNAQQLFEENGWSKGEIPVKSLAISDYLVQQ